MSDQTENTPAPQEEEPAAATAPAPAATRSCPFEGRRRGSSWWRPERW